MSKSFSRQSKELISNKIGYFEAERDNGGPLIPLTAVRERVAQAFKINVSTVNSVSTIVKSGGLLESPKKKKDRRKPVCDIDDFDQVAIRNIVYEMYRNKQHITRTTILSLLRERDIFHGSISTLGRILKDTGFKYNKDDPRRGLMEVPHIAFSRITFLEKYVRNVNSPCPNQFEYLDETWVFENGSVGRSWQDSSKETVKKIKTEGKRYIIVHAGNQNGFIPGASLIFCSKTKDPDYHGEMNAENFSKWFENKLLPGLEEPSVIIMDNASYHSSLLNKFPNGGWKKADICGWLNEHNVKYDPHLQRIQFLDLVTQNKPPKIYMVDRLAEQYGHTVLRLPPYHCIFNPIENVWGIAKTYYNKHIGRDVYGEEKVLKMWQEALDTITPQIWSNTIQHTEEIIKKWWDREVGFDRDDVAPLIINVVDGNDSDCNNGDSSDTD